MTRESEQRSLNSLRDLIHDHAKAKGWWSKPTDTIAAKLLLVHSEISEAVEILREARPCPFGAPEVDYDDLRKETRWHGKPEGFPTEIADTIIRLLDLCGQLNIDIEGVLLRKVEFNTSREMRHGGKAI